MPAEGEHISRLGLSSVSRNMNGKEQRIIQRALNARVDRVNLGQPAAGANDARVSLRLAAPEPLCLLDRADLRADFPGQSIRRQQAVASLLSLFSHSA